MLDEHFVDGFGADVGIERTAAEPHEFVELALEFGIVLVGGVNLVFELGSDLADLLAVALGGFVEVVEGFCSVTEVLAEQGGEVFLFADVGAAGFVAVLIKNGGDGVLEDDVLSG